MSYGIIKMNGPLFLTADNIPLGNSLKEVMLYYRDDRHSEQKMKLIAQIEANKEKE